MGEQPSDGVNFVGVAQRLSRTQSQRTFGWNRGALISRFLGKCDRVLAVPGIPRYLGPTLITAAFLSPPPKSHRPRIRSVHHLILGVPVVSAGQTPPYPNMRHAHGVSPQQHQTSMAAPPLPLPPSTQTQPAGTSTAGSSPRPPLSPHSQNREQERISLLLGINVDLLQEVNRLQAEGRGGATSAQQQLQLKQQGQPDNMASDEYIQCLRRVQANLSYLMPKARDDPQKTPLGPVYMSHPPHMPQLQPKYDQLTSLFPGWSGIEGRSSMSSGSPNPNNSINGMMASPVSMGPT
nr:hypothetical protein CFP56_78629 [Quercus suber]